MIFSELMQGVRDDPAGVRIPASWGQGRAAFGGLAAALVYERMRARVPAQRPVRSLAITFVAPMAVEQPLQFEVEVLREGRAVSQVVGRAMQDGQVVTLVQGSFGGSRESSIRIEAEPAPALKAPEDCQELPYIKGVTPEFTRYLAMRWAVGGLPFSNTPNRQMGGWVGFRNEPQARRIDEADLLALVDAWPPALLPYLRAPAPGSSLTWTIEFIQPLPTLSNQDRFAYLADIEHAHGGYGHVAAKLWSPAGELLAISRQTVTVFG